MPIDASKDCITVERARQWRGALALAGAFSFRASAAYGICPKSARTGG